MANIKEAAPGSKSKGFSQLYNSFATLFNALEESDMRVTSQVAESVKTTGIQLRQLEENWSQIKSIELPKINAELRKAGRTETIKADQ